MTTIYALINPFTQHPYYVGKTEQKLSYRLRSHICTKYTSTTKNVLKWGKEPEIIELDFGSYEEAFDLETYWIYQLRAWGFFLENKKISHSRYTVNKSLKVGRYDRSLPERKTFFYRTATL